MAAAVTTVEGVVNIALELMGYPKRVASLMDGSAASVKMLDIYAQTRDQMLRQVAPPFARRDIQLTLLKSAPAGGYGTTPWTNAYPIRPYQYEYTYPSDCLAILYPVVTPVTLPILDPQPILFTQGNDTAYSPPRRVILSDTANLGLGYVGQVIEVGSWTPDFVQVVAEALSKSLAPALKDNQQLVEFWKTQEAMLEKQLAGTDSRNEV